MDSPFSTPNTTWKPPPQPHPKTPKEEKEAPILSDATSH